jgi:thymidylate kinase
MRYRLVYFFGPDGTGKTTQAELVSSYLRRKGTRVLRATVKQHHTLSYLLLRLLRTNNDEYLRINYFGFNDATSERVRRPWKALELFSLLPAIVYRVLLPSVFGYTVVCDRYVVDTLVVLSYFLKDPKLISGSTARLLIRLIPKRALLIHLDTNTKTILARKKDEPLTEELVDYYRAAYKKIVNLFNLPATTIDTSCASVEAVQQKVVEMIERGLPS